MNEIDKIKERYEARQTPELISKYSNELHYNKCIVKEREQAYFFAIKQKFQHIHNLSLLEIGAGSGGNISGFLKMGFQLKHIVVNELLDDRVVALKNNFPELEIHPVMC